MKNWGRFFRRQSQGTTALKEDYPTHSESDITDDESRQREWENHLKRRSTLANTAAANNANLNSELNNWDVQSESDYNLQFPSDTSLIDGYQEGRYNYHHPDDGEFERVLKNAVSYERKHSEEKGDRTGFRYSLHPSDVKSKQSKGPQDPPRSPAISERIRDLEQRMTGKRRASFVPQVKPSTERQFERSEDYDRYATWNNVGVKRKVRKNSKKRKRANANELSFDASDDESKYTVSLTMEDLNSIIKKNINSAVRTIVSATSKVNKANVRPVSPADSFSTETETIFSGSSNQSTEPQPGALHKQISWQIDAGGLKGVRRKSLAAGQLPAVIDTGQQIPYDNRRHSIVPNQFPRINELPPSPYLSPRQEQDQTYYQQQPASVPPPPPPPPPPPQPSAAPPQVTFNLTPQQPTGFPGMSNQMQYQQSPMFPASTLSNIRPSVDFGDPYAAQTMADLSNIAASNRYRRRHTLASLDTGDLLATTESALDAKVEQLNNVLNLLDKNINHTETEAKSAESSVNKTDRTASHQLTSEAGSQNVPSTVSGGLAPVLSIADQIAALTKKKKKPLEPGQIRMSSCARAVLILTNIAFLIIGGGASGLGVWLMMDPNIENYFAMLNVDQTGQDFKSICYALIGIGAFILTIAFTGCCGTVKSSRCLLTAFLVMVTVICLAEAGLGTLVFLHLDSPTAIPVLSAILSNMEDSLRKTLTKSIVEKYDPSTMIGTTWNLVQIQLECCGGSGPEDYQLSAWKNETTNELTIPDECCVLINKEAEVPEPSNKLLCQLGTVGFFHDTGCFDMMKSWFKTNSTYIIAAGLSSIAIEIFAFISAVLICQKGKRSINKDTETSN